MIREYKNMCAYLSAAPNQPKSASRIVLTVLILAGLTAGMVGSVMAGDLGPDSQTSPAEMQRYTDNPDPDSGMRSRLAVG